MKFEGNDLPGDNALWQAIGNESVHAGIAGLSGAVDTLALTTEHWSQAPPDKVTPMTAVNWMSVMEKASVQRMYAEEATRLSSQVAQEVSTLNSRVYS